MSLRILLLAVIAVALTPLSAAAKSCSAFAAIKAYDAEKSEVTLKFTKGTEMRFFPRTEGAPFISKLPKNGYKSRYADDRIGYFMTAQKDWTVGHNEKTVFKRKIHRWNLEKQDPKAAESPVKEPIIFYIEKTVPVKFRRYVREGILMWNKSFEKCGFLDAVQVRQQTDTNEFKDLDP